MILTWKFSCGVLAVYLVWLHRRQSRLLDAAITDARMFIEQIQKLRETQLEFMKLVYGRWDDEDKNLDDTPGQLGILATDKPSEGAE